MLLFVLRITLIGYVVSTSSRIPDDPEKCLYWKEDNVIPNKTDLSLAHHETEAKNSSTCASYCLKIYPDCRASSFKKNTKECKLFKYAKKETDLKEEIGTEYLVVGEGALEPDGLEVSLKKKQHKNPSFLCYRHTFFKIFHKKQPSSANSSINGNYTCKGGWNQYGAYCYQYRKELKTFDQADFTCQRYGGELVSIHSRKENEFVVSLM